MGVFLRGSEDFLERFIRDRRANTAKLDPATTWDNDNDGYWYIGITTPADPSNKDDWRRQHTWLSEQLTCFLRTFKPYADRAHGA